MTSLEPDLASRLELVRGRVADVALAAGRDPAGITTVVVTKFHPAALVRQLFELGVRDFGESRHQEAKAKVAELVDLNATWHFVGQLQSKKAALVRSYARVLHSVDRSSLVDALGGGEQRDVFLQVNLTDDPGRGGARPADILPIAERVAATAGLRLLGLMAVAPLGAEPRAEFARVRELADEVRRIVPSATGLSIGMSADFREAILEGATHLRIGTAITGIRPKHG